jgi:hypothetical protein
VVFPTVGHASELAGGVGARIGDEVLEEGFRAGGSALLVRRA